jgi:hypothetical protein
MNQAKIRSTRRITRMLMLTRILQECVLGKCDQYADDFRSTSFFFGSGSVYVHAYVNHINTHFGMRTWLLASFFFARHVHFRHFACIYEIYPHVFRAHCPYDSSRCLRRFHDLVSLPRMSRTYACFWINRITFQTFTKHGDVVCSAIPSINIMHYYRAS